MDREMHKNHQYKAQHVVVPTSIHSLPLTQSSAFNQVTVEQVIRPPKRKLTCKECIPTITTVIAILAFWLILTLILSRAVAGYNAATQPNRCQLWTNRDLSGVYLQTLKLGMGGGPRCILWKTTPSDDLEGEPPRPLDLSWVVAGTVLLIVVLTVVVFAAVGFTQRSCLI